MIRPRHIPSANPGFSLTEVMVAMTVLGFLTMGIAAFMLDVGRGLFWATQKAAISQDIRHFTMQLASEARSSNSAIIYRSFSPQDRASAADRRNDRQSGDCLVLVSTIPWPNTNSPRCLSRIIAYYRKPNQNGEGPVHKFVREFSTPLSLDNTSIEQILLNLSPTISSSDPQVLELSRGLSDGRLFTNVRQGRVVVVNGEIMHGNKVKEITNTYNLSVSPRG